MVRVNKGRTRFGALHAFSLPSPLPPRLLAYWTRMVALHDEVHAEPAGFLHQALSGWVKGGGYANEGLGAGTHRLPHSGRAASRVEYHVDGTGAFAPQQHGLVLVPGPRSGDKDAGRRALSLPGPQDRVRREAHLATANTRSWCTAANCARTRPSGLAAPKRSNVSPGDAFSL